MPASSYPRRQALRRRQYAAARAIEAAAALAAALLLMVADVTPLAAMLCLTGVTLLIDGAGAAREARRSSVGADSEARVRRELARLRREGWHVRHGVSWPCGGDIDHVVRTPDGFEFAIETKTLRYDRGQLERTAATAQWLARRRRRYTRGVVPVLCVVRARRAPVIEHGVLVVSIDGLLDALRAAAVECPRAGATGGSRSALGDSLTDLRCDRAHQPRREILEIVELRPATVARVRHPRPHRSDRAGGHSR